MNWLDVTLVCLAGLGFMKGLFDGFVKQVISLITLVFAIYFCGQIAHWLQSFFQESGWITGVASFVLSYIAGFGLIVGVISFIGSIIDNLVDSTPLSIFNHMAGGLFGVLTMNLFLSLFVNFYELVDPLNYMISQKTKESSRFYYFTKSIIPTIYDPFHFFERKGEKDNDSTLKSV